MPTTPPLTAEERDLVISREATCWQRDWLPIIARECPDLDTATERVRDILVPMMGGSSGRSSPSDPALSMFWETTSRGIRVEVQERGTLAVQRTGIVTFREVVAAMRGEAVRRQAVLF